MAVLPPRVIARRPFAPVLDRLGATGSLLCAAHCAALPLLIVLLPSLGLGAWLDDRVEMAFVLFASGLGLFSLVQGYRRHRTGRALALLVPGLAALWAGIGFAPLHASLVPHAVVMTLGGSLVGLAHLLNLRLHRAHVGEGCCQP